MFSFCKNIFSTQQNFLGTCRVRSTHHRESKIDDLSSNDTVLGVLSTPYRSHFKNCCVVKRCCWIRFLKSDHSVTFESKNVVSALSFEVRHLFCYGQFAKTGPFTQASSPSPPPRLLKPFPPFSLSLWSPPLKMSLLSSPKSESRPK